MTSITFTKPVMTRIHGKPTPADMLIFRQECLNNAVSIPNPSAGKYGHMGMMLGAAEYCRVTNTNVPDWEEPPAPGAYPAMGVLDTLEHNKQRVHEFDARTRACEIFTASENGLRAIMLAALDQAYYEGARGNEFTIHAILPRVIVEYLIRKYGNIGSREIEANRKSLEDPWDGHGSIAVLLARIKNTRDFASKAGAPISDIDAMNALLTILAQIPDFKLACDEQRRINVHEWGWELDIEFFEGVDSGRENTTTGAAGFQSAHAAAQVKNGGGGGNGGGSNNHTGGGNNGGGDNQFDENGKRRNNYYMCIVAYCWTHGWSTKLGHNSMTCPSDNRKPGHNEEATYFDQRGRCTTTQMPGHRILKRKPESGGVDHRPKNDKEGSQQTIMHLAMTVTKPTQL